MTPALLEFLLVFMGNFCLFKFFQKYIFHPVFQGRLSSTMDGRAFFPPRLLLYLDNTLKKYCATPLATIMKGFPCYMLQTVFIVLTTVPMASEFEIEK